jgi:hypothetical protein
LGAGLPVASIEAGEAIETRYESRVSPRFRVCFECVTGCERCVSSVFAERGLSLR